MDLQYTSYPGIQSPMWSSSFMPLWPDLYEPFSLTPLHIDWLLLQFSPVTHLCLTLRPHGLQHTRIPCPLPTPRACSSSCPLSQWCHPTISSSVVPFLSCLQSFPASGSFQTSQFFPIGDQSRASAAVLPINIQDWFSLGWTGWISLQWLLLKPLKTPSSFPN